MFQYTHEEKARLQQKSNENPKIIETLREKIQLFLDRPLNIPKEGIANWKLYYYCPKHSVQLTFDYDAPHKHRCPVDGEVFTGEPYDSTWWGFVNERNYQGAYHSGLLYMITGDLTYAAKAKAVLMGYATYYPSYKVHGNIPYNNPGKAGAQALDEGMFIRHLAYAYDLIEETLSEEEKIHIKTNLLLEGALFLMGQRTPQLHNHEVIINAAIGVVGIILERQDLIDFAVYTEYGLKDQLEKGVLEDCLWFEGSIAYHFYALSSFFGYEKFAVHTPHSLIYHPNYKKMLTGVIDLLQPDYTFPLLNDMHVGQGALDGYQLYEFGYKVFEDERLLQVLNKVYETKKRDTQEAFFYGVETLPESQPLVSKTYHHPKGSGLTVMRAKDEKYLLFKHSPYGGEHDHYDRLGLSYSAYGKAIMPDLGTTGYGAILHYDYYKNTGTHNTVVIDEANQMPGSCKVYHYKETPDTTFVDAGITFTKDYVMPDSFTIKQWDDEAYEGATMRRRILWCEDYFVEVFSVKHTKTHTIDWVAHIRGERQEEKEEQVVEGFSTQKPYKYLHDIKQAASQDQNVTQWVIDETIGFTVHSYVPKGTTYYAQGPDNPSISDLSYMIHRVEGDQALFVHVYEAHKEQPIIQKVDFEPGFNEVTIHIHTNEGINDHTLSTT